MDSSQKCDDQLELLASSGIKMSRMDELDNLKIAQGQAPSYRSAVEKISQTAIQEPSAMYRALSSLGLDLLKNEEAVEIEDTDAAILLMRKAIELAPINEDVQFGLLAVYQLCLENKFWRFQSAEILDENISVLTDLSTKPQAGKIGRGHIIFNLATLLQARFARNDTLDDLQKAITLGREATELYRGTPFEDFQIPRNTAEWILQKIERSKIERFKPPDELEEAIKLLQEALDLCHDEDWGKASCLNELGVALMFKNSITGLSDILGQSIDTFEKALLVDNQNATGRVIIEKNLSKVLERRYKMSKSLDDLERAISLLDLTAKSSAPCDPEILIRLGTQLFLKYKESEHLPDSVRAIEVLGEGITTTTSTTTKATLLERIADIHLLRYELEHDLEDLDEAVATLETAVQATPSDGVDMASLVLKLCETLHKRSVKTQSLKDIDKQHDHLERACKNCSNESERAIYLSSIANVLYMKYELTGRLDDLDEAIGGMISAIGKLPDKDPGILELLGRAGLAYLGRYDQTMEREDLEKAINMSEKAFRSLPVGDEIWITTGINLSKMYMSIGDWLVPASTEIVQEWFTTYNKTEEDIGTVTPENPYKPLIDTVNKGIKTNEDVLEALPPGHRLKPLLLANLSVKLEMRYKLFRNTRDLIESLAKIQEAYDITPLDSPERAKRLEILSSRLGEMNKEKVLLGDIEYYIDNIVLILLQAAKEVPEILDMMSSIGISKGAMYKGEGTVSELSKILRDLSTLLETLCDEKHPARDVIEKLTAKPLAARMPLPEWLAERGSISVASYREALDIFENGDIAEGYKGRPTKGKLPVMFVPPTARKELYAKREEELERLVRDLMSSRDEAPSASFGAFGRGHDLMLQEDKTRVENLRMVLSSLGFRFSEIMPDWSEGNETAGKGSQTTTNLTTTQDPKCIVL